MRKVDTNLWIKGACRRHGLSPADLSSLCRVSIPTARSWVRPKGTRARRKAPEMAVELIALKLGDPNPFEKAAASKR